MSLFGAVADHYVAASVNPYATEILADSPLLYWKFDETSGTTAADSSGNSKTGTYFNSPTLGASSLIPSEPAGKAMSTTASSAQSAFRSTEAALNPASITIEGTWKITGSPGSSGIHTLAAKDSIDAIFSARGWSLQFADSTNVLTWTSFIGIGGTIRFILNYTIPALKTAQQLISASYDGSTARLYVAGAEVANTSLNSSGGTLTGALAAPGSAVQVGKDSTSGSKYAMGGIADSFSMWNTALSATRIGVHAASWL